MTPRKTILLIALISMAPAAMVVAQDTPPPTQDTSPSAASSPSQRGTTSTPSSETMPSQGTDPSAASSPSQQQSLRTANKQSMKNCIAQQQKDNSGMSASDAKKACKAQMKANSG